MLVSKKVCNPPLGPEQLYTRIIVTTLYTGKMGSPPLVPVLLYLHTYSGVRFIPQSEFEVTLMEACPSRDITIRVLDHLIHQATK
jgi:hypothetical protein